MIHSAKDIKELEVSVTDGSLGSSADIGGRLRRARLQRGLSVHDLGGLTKLPIHVLQAIERNHFESLPGGMYRKAYLRTLAGEVGLNPNEIAEDYEKHFEPLNARHRD